MSEQIIADAVAQLDAIANAERSPDHGDRRRMILSIKDAFQAAETIKLRWQNDSLAPANAASPDLDGYAKPLITLAEIFRRMGVTTMAQRVYEVGVELADEHCARNNVDLHRGALYANLAITHLELGQYAKGLSWLHAAAEQDIRHRNVAGIYDSYAFSDDGPPLLSPRLCFIVGDGQLNGIKGMWADTTTVRLEKMIRQLVDAIRRYLEAQRQVRLDAECERRQEERARTVRRASANEAKEEFYLRQNLIQEVDRWRKASEIRDYLAAIQRQIEEGVVKPADKDRFDGWMKWAKWFADDMDPLISALPPEDRLPIVPRNVPVNELDLTSRARALVVQLEVKDAEELLHVPEDKIRQLSGWSSGMWRELTLVLEGLGYNVSKRKTSYYW